jgi:PII-like signaling protein
LGIPDAIVFRGIEGYGSASRIRHASHWPLSKDAPVKMSVIGTDEQIAQLIPFLDAMVKEGLIATSAVEAIRYSRAPEKTAGKP